MDRNLGTYINKDTGGTYNVIERSREVKHKPIRGMARRLPSSIHYVTSCGIDVQPLNDELTSFELIQIDGVIEKLDA